MSLFTQNITKILNYHNQFLLVLECGLVRFCLKFCIHTPFSDRIPGKLKSLMGLLSKLDIFTRSEQPTNKRPVYEVDLKCLQCRCSGTVPAGACGLHVKWSKITEAWAASSASNQQEYGAGNWAPSSSESKDAQGFFYELKWRKQIQLDEAAGQAEEKLTTLTLPVCLRLLHQDKRNKRGQKKWSLGVFEIV